MWKAHGLAWGEVCSEQGDLELQEARSADITPSIPPPPNFFLLKVPDIYSDLNGETALVVIYVGRLETVLIFSTDADRITAIRAVRNPEKLAWLAAHTGLGAGDGAASWAYSGM